MTESPSPQKPNVLIIMSDQHHAGVLGCAGDGIIRTPHMDRLAESGLRLPNAYCSSPLCGPSRMSFMTGRHPHEIQQWDNCRQLSSDTPTFAHAFLAGGYETVLSGRMHFTGWDQLHGFSKHLIGDCPESVYLADGFKLKRVLGYLSDTPGMSLTGVVKSGPGASGYLAYDELVTRETVDWLQQRGTTESSDPFLLTVGYVCPHCPFVSSPEDFAYYRDRISTEDLPAPDEHLHLRNAALRKAFGTDPEPPVDAQWRTRVAYYGMTDFLDRQVGAVLDALEKSGEADRTIVVYCSDHGEMLGEHGMWWKSCFYDGSCRVPLIVSWPGHVPSGTVRSENVSLMDIGTTLLDLAGLDPLPESSGRSFQSLLTDGSGEWDDTVFAEYTLDNICRMVRSGPWKYNYYHGMGAELFNLESDPDELEDLSGQSRYREIEERLHERLLQGWDPDQVVEATQRWREERKLVANWVRETEPPEPYPLWFTEEPENHVDQSIQPPA